MNKQNNIPKLRFPEFKGEWTNKEGNNIFETISNKNHNSDLPILAITQEHGAIPRDLIDFNISVTDKSIETYKVVEKGDFIISLRTFQGGIEYSDYKGICSPAYIILRPHVMIDNNFFRFYFKTDRYIQSLNRKLEGIRDGKMISFKYFSEATITFPTLPEQTRIASFFTTIDQKLSQLKQKKTLLEQYKKGVMQKLFSQELRFKDVPSTSSGTDVAVVEPVETTLGKDFPEWEERAFGDCFSSLSSKKCQIRTTEFQLEGKYKVIDQGQDIIAGFSDDESLIFTNIPVIIFGDHTAILKFIDFEFIVGADGTKLLKNKEDDDLKYLFYNLSYNNVKQEGYKRHFLALNEATLQIPCRKEQTLIANFLTAIDEKINRTENQIQQTQEWKKGLLQRMFV